LMRRRHQRGSERMSKGEGGGRDSRNIPTRAISWFLCDMSRESDLQEERNKEKEIKERREVHLQQNVNNLFVGVLHSIYVYVYVCCVTECSNLPPPPHTHSLIYVT